MQQLQVKGVAQGPNGAGSLLTFTGFKPVTFQLLVQIPNLRATPPPKNRIMLKMLKLRVLDEQNLIWREMTEPKLEPVL